MKICETILPQFEHEMALTRKVLERVPDSKFDWKPHPKSMSMGALAGHLATIPDWTVSTIKQDEFDFAPVGKPAYRPPDLKTRAELLAAFDKGVSAGREAIAGVSDEALQKPWTLKAGGKVIFSMPRIAVLRGFVISHTIHHRAQMTVYFRLNDIPVPSIYGPSADEGQM